MCVCQSSRLVRLTSPNLNYVMIVGISLIYCSAILFVIPTISPPVVVALCLVSAIDDYIVMMTIRYF